MQYMTTNQPSPAFIGASWAVLFIGVVSYCFGLWNAKMMLNEKGFYFAVLCLGLYSAVSLQKTIRDRMEGIPTSRMYYMISWFALIVAVALELVGLWNVALTLSEKGFYLIAFTMSLFASITVQKNVRDVQQAIENDYGTEQIEHNSERNSILQSPFRRKEEEE